LGPIPNPQSPKIFLKIKNISENQKKPLKIYVLKKLVNFPRKVVEKKLISLNN
jgi:hypothetical protein